MRHTLCRALLGLFVFLTIGICDVNADLIPVGNKGVSHKLVFINSPLLESHRMIAMPVRGFGGYEEVRPNHAFHFSSKYGTRLYVVPSDFVPPSKLNRGEPLPFPSCEVPISSTTYVPILSPVASLRTTCNLVAVDEETIEVEVVDHVELDSSGNPASLLNTVLPLLLLSATGLVGCCFVWRQTRKVNDEKVA